MPNASKPPLIGLTSSTRYEKDWDQTTELAADYLFRNYASAIQAAGGWPIIIPTLHPAHYVELLAERLDGLVLAGGVDIDPLEYGQPPHSGLGTVDKDRDALELELARFAASKGLPTLGICRGAQVVNVALGGTLYQDIPSQMNKDIAHKQSEPRHRVSHAVRLEPATRLHRLIGRDEIMVNSGHHQAVCDVAPDLIVSARSLDDMVEAVELPDHPFFLAVQWHPEGTAHLDEPSARLFSGLVTAAKST
jgi:putative glutamine amidotransferase